MSRAEAVSTRAYRAPRGVGRIPRKYNIRIDARVWEAMRIWAADEKRSQTAQVEAVLTEAFRAAGRGLVTRMDAQGSSRDPT